mmetsp:Transcript_19688/g.31257  ORF Transcript_19688/g.31257 Transcript_19688/m.31257 type:complete len:85 (-) Transcript_19688:1461-1715(-)
MKYPWLASDVVKLFILFFMLVHNILQLLSQDPTGGVRKPLHWMNSLRVPIGIVFVLGAHEPVYLGRIPVFGTNEINVKMLRSYS